MQLLARDDVLSGKQAVYAHSPSFHHLCCTWWLIPPKIKQFLKSAKARTEEGLIQAIGKAFQDVKPSHALGWFNHCGYVTTQS